MSPFSKSLGILLSGILCLGSASAGLALIVEYKPYGVPDSRRAEYESMLVDLERRANERERLKSRAVPNAVIPQRTHAFGMLDPHTSASHEFNIRNAGDAYLDLEVKQTTCKCTVGELGKSSLAPGESTVVRMIWNTGYQAELYEQTAELHTNDPALPVVQLTVSGTVRAQCVAPQTITLPEQDLNESSETSFLVYSQLWDELAVTDVSADLPGFQWSTEPVDPAVEAELVDTEARSAWRVTVSVLPQQYGSFSGQAVLQIVPPSGGEMITREIQVHGGVRPAISFQSPDLHRHEGLNIGTLVSGEAYDFPIIVRQRSELNRRLEVLDVMPPTLRAKIDPLSTAGSYRLTVTVPENSASVMFNRDQQHGYVQVGDPRHPEFSNCFPVYGAIVELDD